MLRPQVMLVPGTSADAGQVAVHFRDLYPDHQKRPTSVDPDAVNAPYNRLSLLYVRGQLFLPVYPGMWFGMYVYYCNGGSMLAHVSLRRTGGAWPPQNLWRASLTEIIEGDPTGVDESLCWAIGQYSGITIASQMDRSRLDSGDPNGGRVEPFVVSTNEDDIPTFPGYFDQLDVWRRDMRREDQPGDSIFSRRATPVCQVTLIWRKTAEQILRGMDAVAEHEPVRWTA